MDPRITHGKGTYGVEEIRVRPPAGQKQFNRRTGKMHDARLVIGKYCSIANDVQVFLGDNHRPDWISTYPFAAGGGEKGHPATNGDVVIGNDVWIGAGTTIMSGVRIGDGAVVAAGSHVASNVRPYSVVGGNPAQLYYYRFAADDIESLLRIRWWDWPDDRLKRVIPLLVTGDLKAFFREAEILTKKI